MALSCVPGADALCNDCALDSDVCWKLILELAVAQRLVTQGICLVLVHKLSSNQRGVDPAFVLLVTRDRPEVLCWE